jgi:hypothetical protein
MGNDDDNDYDTDANWKTSLTSPLVQSTPNSKIVIHDNDKMRTTTIIDQPPLTIHQIIVKKFPDLNLPELKRFHTSPTASIVEEKINSHDGTGGGGTLTRRQRISAYDNVEKNGRIENSHGYAQTSILNFIESSAQSDDGTVFSEPWDSSQWDSFLPNNDDSSDTIHLSKCRPAVNLSEDDTIIEDPTIASIRPTTNQPQKIATILRNNRLCRDRDILCK